MAAAQNFVEVSVPEHRDVDKKLTIVVISDTHCKHEMFGEIPEGDILIHCGDFCEEGSAEEARDFASWFSQQSHPHKLVISGNHDVSGRVDFMAAVKERSEKKSGEKKKKKKKEILSFSARKSNHFFNEENGIKFLNNETITIDGINFYGVEWSKRGRKIPEGTNVLISHEPPHGILDLDATTNRHIGSEGLKEDLEKCENLWVHVFGHVHLSRGTQQNESSPVFINAASANMRFGKRADGVHPPYKFEI